MQIVNHCSFKKLTVSLLSIIFPFHVYLHPLALRVQKKNNNTQNPIKPYKMQKKPTRVGLFFKYRVFRNSGHKKYFYSPCSPSHSIKGQKH